MNFEGGAVSSCRTVGGRVEGIKISAGEFTISISV